MAFPFRQLFIFLALAALQLAALQGSNDPATDPALSPPPPTLTAIREAFLRWPELTADDQPVRFEGVVTSTMPGGAFRMHDGEKGIFVSKGRAAPEISAGEHVIVTGTLRKGGFSPWITPRKVDRVGLAPYPPAQAVDFQVLAAGSADNQWVEIEGVVRAAQIRGAGDFIVLDLGMVGGNLQVLVTFHPGDDAASLIDASVRIRGVAAVNVNAQHQVVEPSFRVPGFSQITILQNGAADPFAQPPTPANQLLGFGMGAPGPQRRIRTGGVVTRQLSPTMFFIRNGETGLKVELSDPQQLHVGDQVDVAGFPTIENGMAVMEQSKVKRLGASEFPKPSQPTLSALLAGKYNSDLVRTSARLVDWVRAGDSVTLIFQAGDQLFKGLLTLPASSALTLPERNSTVTVTGICVVSELEDLWFYQPRSFLLLVADVGEVTLVQAPPWWTPRRLSRALTIALGVLLAVAAWVWLLRREISRTRSVIQQQARHSAVLEERSRIARDLHDTLEQGLTGLSLQMKAMEKDLTDAPAEARTHLHAARQMLKHSRALARDAIRELRSDLKPDPHENLLGSLTRMTDTWNQSGALQVTMRVEGNIEALPPRIEHQVLGVSTEAVTNAVKHSQAANVRIEITRTDAELRLRVIDDGTGFDAAARLDPTSGSYGLIGMHERVRELGGELTIQSEIGNGTRVTAIIPLRPAKLGSAFVAHSGKAPARTAGSPVTEILGHAGAEEAVP